ncbi:uncharacterized protein LOC106882171 isoform X1 [Octopus bimaculoides]|uniref:Uncharacterized protein n=2 Tax=Octopus bimaculoides TaxID=37653 RepID=A0A0L8FNR4_OCTBM|nr:uncharacterized protein LOC106882171 isoform X1 [Octopus bimaculoides]|eukprot:XP_014788242.1 PREDICTED: uncharacterized protein LOC106882171 isoform X1 [Octopus bimaculoides]
MSASRMSSKLFLNNRYSLKKFVSFNRQYCYKIPNEHDVVRIGCASGFWGDTAVAAPQLIHHGKIDFLVFDYLSEITMSLLTAAKQKNPAMGYAPDFIHFSLAPYLKTIKEKKIRVVSNAGGINPLSCAEVLKKLSKEAGVDMNIAVVTGDDLMPKVKEISQSNIQEMSSGMKIPKTIHSMNAYLGAGPIARALDLGADIVVSGRCVDSALVLGPLIHAFKYNNSNFDQLASASLAGHIIECGAQATGGVFTDWQTVHNWDNIGFPIVEFSANGSFSVSKPPSTGGLVSKGTVCEQLLYEIGDPKNYILPDIICDFSQVQVFESEKDSVQVKGALGKPPTNDYKVTATYADGYRVTAVTCIGGPQAEEKAKKTTDAILKRCRNIFKQLKLGDFIRVNVEILGFESKNENKEEPRQLAVWMAAHHPKKQALEILSREIAPAGTGMAPGLTAIAGGRPRVSPVLKLFSFLYPKDELKVQIYMNGELKESYQPSEYSPTLKENVSESSANSEESNLPTGNCEFYLKDLAYTRSGDKGNSANIGVIARHPSYLPYLRAALTESAVEKYFSSLFEDDDDGKRVTRYDVPGINAMNFVLHNCLGGGGIASLRSDPQGKALGQHLLNFKITNVPDLLSKIF